MEAPTSQSPEQILEKLKEIRAKALEDPTHYVNSIPGLIQANLITPSASVELRRWGTDFIAEALSCPSLPSERKQQLSLAVLKTLREYLETPKEDTTVTQSVIQASTSAYPLIFKHVIYNLSEATVWQDQCAVKTNILKRESYASAGVKVSCIKFIQRIVQVQTPGIIADPRRSDQNELSLALVPNEHPLLSPSHLQAEALGLLDRMLSVFHDTNPSDAVLVTATLNSVGVLVRSRATVATRILNAVLMFNPFRGASPTSSPRVRITIKSMERTIRAFLTNINKRNPSHPMAGRISGYLDHMMMLRAEVFEERGRKRSPPVEPTDGLDNVKRQRLGAGVPESSPQQAAVSSLPAGGRCTLAEMFSLTPNEGLRAFDVKRIPIHILQHLVPPLLAQANADQTSNAIEAILARWNHLQTTQASSPLDAARDATGAMDDDEEYQPEEGAEQIANRIEKTVEPVLPPPAVNLGPFIVPQPPPLSKEDVIEYGKGTITRVFGAVGELQDPSSKATKSGFNRVAASSYDRDSWITVVSRLATRSMSGLETESDEIKKEGPDGTFTREGYTMGDSLRESVFRYVLDDWRKRLDIAVSWLNEEWYNDQVSRQENDAAPRNYERWVLKVYEGIFPYLDAKDRHLIRFLSEIPSVSTEILDGVKRLAQDPERVSLAVQAIYYLVLYRPPVREICLDALEDLYHNYEDAKAVAGKTLSKWRPAALEAKTEAKAEEDAKFTKSPTQAPTAVAT